jgi:hypothetical protein
MGGAINMVSRKPTKEVELEGRVGTVFRGDLDRAIPTPRTGASTRRSA